MPIRLLFLLLSVWISGCQNSRETSHKIYRFDIGSSDKFHSIVQWLLEDFNTHIGFHALVAVDDNPANSTIRFPDIAGTAEFGDTIGTGRWSVKTRERSGFADMKPVRDTTRLYGMHLELDRRLVWEKWTSGTDKDLALLRVLFFHEVGHGLTMNHSSNARDIMFPSIGIDKDFFSFFISAREFFSKP